ncbi:2-hydroxyacyl-CoA dehydratase family protein [Moorellaceae bacterium AZ2]
MGEAESNVIGWFCSYTPVELIQALGFKPQRLLPPPGKTPRADTYFTGNLCPYVKAALESALGGQFPPLAGTIFVASCNAMIHLSYIWRSLQLSQQVWVLDVPRRGDSLAVNYWAQRLKELAAELSGYFNRPLEEETLWQAIQEENHRRQLGRALLEERAAGHWPLEGRKLLCLINQGDRVLLEKVIEQAREAGSLQASPPDHYRSRPRLLLIGSVLPEALLEIVEEAGMFSVYEDACNGGRLLGRAPERASDPYLYLAQLYLHKPPCPRMASEKDRRRAYLREIIRTYRIDGAIYHAMKFCDLAMVDFVLVKEELEKVGIPLLKLEGDYTGGNRGQWATRIEAFREML